MGSARPRRKSRRCSSGARWRACCQTAPRSSATTASYAVRGAPRQMSRSDAASEARICELVEADGDEEQARKENDDDHNRWDPPPPPGIDDGRVVDHPVQ